MNEEKERKKLQNYLLYFLSHSTNEKIVKIFFKIFIYSYLEICKKKIIWNMNKFCKNRKISQQKARIC